MSWRDRLEAYVAGAQSDSSQREITVSKNVFEKAHAHTVHVIRTTDTHTIAKVRSASSQKVYNTELWRDENRLYPTFPYVWKCSCRWARERFVPCSHVIALALYRGERYDDEYRLDGPRG